ncbi:MAG: hypothetical protein AAF823_02355 [Planctomycetota bacterium]
MTPTCLAAALPVEPGAGWPIETTTLAQSSTAAGGGIGLLVFGLVVIVVLVGVLALIVLGIVALARGRYGLGAALLAGVLGLPLVLFVLMVLTYAASGAAAPGSSGGGVIAAWVVLWWAVGLLAVVGAVVGGALGAAGRPREAWLAARVVGVGLVAFGMIASVGGPMTGAGAQIVWGLTAVIVGGVLVVLSARLIPQADASRGADDGAVESDELRKMQAMDAG